MWTSTTSDVFVNWQCILMDDGYSASKQMILTYYFTGIKIKFKVWWERWEGREKNVYEKQGALSSSPFDFSEIQ